MEEDDEKREKEKEKEESQTYKGDILLLEEGLDDTRGCLFSETHDGVEFQELEELKVDGVDRGTAIDRRLHSRKQRWRTKC